MSRQFRCERERFREFRQEDTMAKVTGVKEKLHMPLYDAFVVPPPPATGTGTAPTFRSLMTDPRMIRFFVDVQNKTKLETNLQASGVLPSQNRFEARALRVVAAGLRAEDLSDLIYHSVTTLLVGEKIMVEAPTYLFPSGAGVSGVALSPTAFVTNHGEPDPMATFRFAEPVTIDPQQNFRIEMLFPQGVPGDGATPARLAAAGSLRIWTILDGCLTRDVQ
jgi:hypothetical protein